MEPEPLKVETEKTGKGELAVDTRTVALRNSITAKSRPHRKMGLKSTQVAKERVLRKQSSEEEASDNGEGARSTDRGHASRLVRRLYEWPSQSTAAGRHQDAHHNHEGR